MDGKGETGSKGFLWDLPYFFRIAFMDWSWISPCMKPFYLFMLQIRLNLGINIPVCFHFIVLNFL
jgi:hypothetical protein